MSSIPLRRLRPSPAVLAALVGALWAGTSGAVREFVWADLRDGVIRVGDLPRATRGLARAGFLLLFAMVGLLVAGDVLRGASDLLATSSGTAARGAQVPVALLPLTLFMFSVAWAFLLAGSIRAHWGVSVGITAIYVASAATWVGSATHLGGLVENGFSWGLVLLVPVVVAIRRRRPERAVAEFALLLLLVAASTGISLLLALRTMRTTGIALPVVSLGLLLQFLRGLVTPLLVLIGLDIADFALRVSRWSSELAEEHLPSFAVPAVIVAIIGWQGYRLAPDVLGSSGAVAGYLGAAGIPALILLATWVAPRLARQRPTATAETTEATGSDVDDPSSAVADDVAGIALPVTVGFLGWQLVLTVALLLLSAFVAAVTLPASMVARVEDLTAAIGGLTGRAELWRTGFWIVALAAAGVFARRGRASLGVYLGVLGSTGLWSMLASPGHPLSGTGWTDPQLQLCWLVVVIGVAARDALAGRLTHGRCHALLMVVVALVLLGASDFIGDPFSPAFAFAGVAFVAFGVVWDALTSGSWTNVGTSRLPRTSRLFLYLGYVQFSVTLIAWAVVSHDLDAVEHFTGGAAMDGFLVLGRPLIYAVIGLLLFRSASSRTDVSAPLDPAPELP